jgi:hypothetical protein
MANVERCTRFGHDTYTGSFLAGVDLRTEVGVIAATTIRFGYLSASTIFGVTFCCCMTVIRCFANDGFTGYAYAFATAAFGSADISVVAKCSIF